MTDPTTMSDAELMAIAGVQPPAAAPTAPRSAASSRPAPAQPRYTGPLPTDASAVFPALVAQESGGRAGVLGPMTRYGQAQGRTQMLPATAQEMARKTGTPWRPELMTGTSPEAAAYQDRLGQAYLEQGLAQTGNMRDALHYYHGGPDRKLWGPKTRRYADEVLARVGGQSLPQVSAAAAPVQPDLAQMSDEELMALAGQEAGPAAAASLSALTPGVDSVTPEWLRAQGIEGDNLSAEDMVRLGYRPNAETGRWEAMAAGAPAEAMGAGVDVPTPGYALALDQERENQKLLDRAGVGTGFTDQLTAPINDELAGAAGFLTQGLGNIGRRLTGRDIEVTAAERAGAAQDLTREEQEAYARENPVQSIAGGVLGGMAFAPAKAAALPGLLGRFGQAAGIGASYGVADGEGVGGRIGGGLLGAGLGAATQGVFEGLPGAARAVSRGVERLRSPNASLPNGTERRVGGALSRALERDNLTPADVLDNLANAPAGRTPLEAGGENLVGLAETMAQAPGKARAGLLSTLRERSDGATNRVSERLADSFGAQGNGFQALRQRISARGEAADAGMAAIADTAVKLDDGSVQALRSRLSSRAVRDAAEEAIAELSPEGSAAANRLFGLGDQLLDNPGAAQITVREAQDISYALNEAASRAYRGGFNSRGEALKTLASTIRNNARQTVGPYDEWLKSFGDASEAIDGLRTGQNVFAKANEKNAMSAAELGERWGKWSAQARENYRLGVGEAILDKVRGGGGVAAMRKLLKNSELADRVKIAFDSEDKFIAFMKSADDEVAMANVDSQVLGGSPTARRVAGAADVNEQSMGPADAIGLLTDLGSPMAMGGRALKALGKRLPRKDRSIIGNEELNGLLGAALTDETAMTRLLNLLEAETGLLRRADGRVRSLGLLALPGASAAGQDRARGLLTANP